MAGPKRKPVPASGRPTLQPIAQAQSTPAPSTDAIAAAGIGHNGGPVMVDDQLTSAPAPAPMPEPAPVAEPAAPPALEPGTVEQPQPDPEPEPEPEPEPIEVRVLVDFGDYLVDDIITCWPDEIEQLLPHGMIDPDPAAVAAARELRA